MAAAWQLPLWYMILIHFCMSAGLLGYDCGEQLSNLTYISLLGVGDCEIKQPTVNVTRIYGQLLQLNEFGLVPTFKCSLKIARTVTHCGMHSHASRVVGGEISYYKEITRDECRNLQTNGFLSVASTQIIGIQRNSTTSRPVIFAGDNDHSGNCYGGSYSDPYGTFKNFYVAGWVEIKLQNSYQPVQIDANRIRVM